MSILGLSENSDNKDESAKKTDDSKQVKKSDDKPVENTSQNDEAKEILAKMEAKKDAGDCPFC